MIEKLGFIPDGFADYFIYDKIQEIIDFCNLLSEKNCGDADCPQSEGEDCFCYRKEEFKACMCACHENTLKKAYSHTERCCSLMNGFVDKSFLEPEVKPSGMEQQCLCHTNGFCVKHMMLHNFKECLTCNPKPEVTEAWPKEGDIYWYIEREGSLLRGIYDRIVSPERKDFGNFFRTRAEAEEALEKIKSLLKTNPLKQ